MKKHPLFTCALVLAFLIFAGGLVLAYMAWSDYGKQQEQLQANLRDTRQLKSFDPAPTNDNIVAATKNLNELIGVLKNQLKFVKGSRTVDSSKAPKTGSDMLFKLQNYRRNFNNDAAATEPYGYFEEDTSSSVPSNVQVPEDFAYGFSRYMLDGAATPPENNHVSIVYRQMEILSYLIETLLEAAPHSIVAVKREHAENIFNRLNTEQPEVADTDPTRERPRASRRARRSQEPEFKDEIQPDAQTLRVAEAVETMAFSVTFTGYSRTLRDFLRTLEAYEMPIVVRSVVVSPVSESMVEEEDTMDNDQPFFTTNETDSGQTLQEITRPVVTENISEFTVTVEYIDVELTPDAEGELDEEPFEDEMAMDSNEEAV